MTIATAPSQEMELISRISDEMHRQARETSLQEVNVLAAGAAAACGALSVVLAAAGAVTGTLTLLPLVGITTAASIGMLAVVEVNNRTLDRLQPGRTA